MSNEFGFRPAINEPEKVEEERPSISKEVSMVKSLFNINPEMNQVHDQLTELARRVDRLEQKLPSSFIPQYRIRDDKDYTPLGGVLDQIFNTFDDLYDKLEQAQTDFNKSMYNESKKLDGPIN